MVPGLARPEKDGNGYEIVAGHRRTHGSELAGLEEMSFIVREMTDHEAVQAMKDSNKQRDGMLPSELAALLELEVEDIKHQGGRLKGVADPVHERELGAGENAGVVAQRELLGPNCGDESGVVVREAGQNDPHDGKQPQRGKQCQQHVTGDQ